MIGALPQTPGYFQTKNVNCFLRFKWFCYLAVQAGTPMTATGNGPLLDI